MPADTYSLDELCNLTGLPKRTVRYYMQVGLVDRPLGETRGAYYTQRHLDQLLQVRRLTEAGVSLERIREVLSGAAAPVPVRVRRPGSVEVRSHLHIAPGIELQISPQEAGLAPEQVRELVRAVMQAAEAVLSDAAPSTPKKE